MKQTLTILALLITLTVHAQTKVKQDAKGNFITVTDSIGGKPTGQTFTDREGKTYPVYISSRGKLYYMRTSKKGNVYKSYIKISTN